MDKSFKKLSKDLSFEGNRLKMYTERLERPDGVTVNYDLIGNRNGAAVLLVDEDGSLVMIRQYRNSIDGMSVEVPGGSKEENESYEECAVREAVEETGYRPSEMEFVCSSSSAVAILDEVTFLYIGKCLKKEETHFDPDEFIDIIKVKPDEALELIKRGEIIDSKTIILIYAYLRTIK